MEHDRGGRPRYPGVLTPAEQRVLDALREGGTNAEIAERLGLSRETVKTHIASMLSKLDLADRGELAAWRPEPPRRGALGWLGLLVRPAVGLGAAAGLVGVVVVFAVVIGASRDDAAPIAVPPAETESREDAAPVDVTATVSPAPDLNIEGCSGVAVRDPEANTELVADCESLLGLRDTIRGTRPLDWTGSKPMSDWTGVTVSGPPQRVTGLDLSDLGLDGQLSGLLGNLTGLTTLDLSGNPLTGMIPSKLALLKSLTTVSLAGAAFEGCAPWSLTAASGLAACYPPGSLGDTPLDAPVPGGTYETMSDQGVLVFDIPADSGLIFEGVQYASPPVEGEAQAYGDFGLNFTNAEKTLRFAIDVHMAGEYPRRYANNFTHRGTATGYTRAEYDAIFDRIVESMWVKDSE